MKIQVTSTDISRGKKAKACQCPIGLAARRVFKERVIVDSDGCHLMGGGRYSLPKEAQNFISRFDKGEPVEPFEFELA